MPEPSMDIINTAIIRAAEGAFKATNALSKLIPNPIGQTDEVVRLTEADVKRLLER